MKSGDNIRVKSGLMSGAYGVVYRTFEEVNDQKQKLLKVVATLQNGVTLSFNEDELEVVTPPGAPPG
ncbi:MAG: hypothetical protein EPN91_08685 [Salinibacterium sp.]|nr:MAG: hypothetical protein EPN91_08685 [Salinibacterium sp.]